MYFFFNWIRLTLLKIWNQINIFCNRITCTDLYKFYIYENFKIPTRKIIREIVSQTSFIFTVRKHNFHLWYDPFVFYIRENSANPHEEIPKVSTANCSSKKRSTFRLHFRESLDSKRTRFATSFRTLHREFISRVFDCAFITSGRCSGKFGFSNGGRLTSGCK